jgi:hypothetical protein
MENLVDNQPYDNKTYPQFCSLLILRYIFLDTDNG